MCPGKSAGKRLSGTKVVIGNQKVQIFEESRFSVVFAGFRAEMGFGTWRIRVCDPFYMQIALRTPLIEVEILKNGKIMKIMVWGT